MIPSFNRQCWILLFGDVVLILLATQLSPWIRIGQPLNVFDVHTGASVFTLFLYLVMLYIFDMYNIGRAFCSDDTALRIVVAVGVAGIFSAFLFYSLPSWKYGRGILLIQVLLVWGFLAGWRWVYSWIFSITLHKKDVLILGAGRCGTALGHLLEAEFSPYRVVGFLDDDPAKQGKVMGSPKVIGPTDRFKEIASKMGVNTAILAITHDRPSGLISLILGARLNGMTILEMPTVYEVLTRRVPVEHIYDHWLLFTDGFYLVSKEYMQKVKRLIDFAVSALLLLGTMPVMALSALAIRLDSPGPVFFKQERVGDRRSEVGDQRSEIRGPNGAVWAEKVDPRVTRVGKWIRLLRIDEIPQLYNVFRGEMSLIGPRPERPEFIQELEKHIPYYGIRHSVRPGITGWAQVNYRYGASVEDALRKLEYDLYYIKKMSLLLDFKIILKTIGVVLFGQGAR
jgi:sugar transferase (PEP-CTERM system associated)